MNQRTKRSILVLLQAIQAICMVPVAYYFQSSEYPMLWATLAVWIFFLLSIILFEGCYLTSAERFYLSIENEAYLKQLDREREAEGKYLEKDLNVKILNQRIKAITDGDYESLEELEKWK